MIKLHLNVTFKGQGHTDNFIHIKLNYEISVRARKQKLELKILLEQQFYSEGYSSLKVKDRIALKIKFYEIGRVISPFGV